MALGAGIFHTFLGEKHRGKQQSKASVAPDNARLPPPTPRCSWALPAPASHIPVLLAPSRTCRCHLDGKSAVRAQPDHTTSHTGRAGWEAAPSTARGISPGQREFFGWPGQADTSSCSRETKPPCRTGKCPEPASLQSPHLITLRTLPNVPPVHQEKKKTAPSHLVLARGGLPGHCPNKRVTQLRVGITLQRENDPHTGTTTHQPKQPNVPTAAQRQPRAQTGPSCAGPVLPVPGWLPGVPPDPAMVVVKPPQRCSPRRRLNPAPAQVPGRGCPLSHRSSRMKHQP